MDRLMKLYTDEVFEEFMDDPKCGVCGELATQRCSKCKQVWYCSRDCQLREWKDHKPICAIFTSNKKEDEVKAENKKQHEKEKASKKKPMI